MAIEQERAQHSNRRPLTLSLLREVGLFGGLPDGALEEMARTLTTLHVDIGTVLFREGDPAREMYVVIEGEIEILKKSRRGRETRVAILGPYDSFGEMAMIDMQPRSATVRTIAPAILIKLSGEDMDALYRRDLRSYTLIVLNIARDLSRRLRVTDGILAEFAASVLDEYVPNGRAR